MITLFSCLAVLFLMGCIGHHIDKSLMRRRWAQDCMKFSDGSGIPTPARSHVGAVHPLVVMARLSQSPAVDSERPSGDGRAILRAVK